MIPSERASQKEQNAANFSSVELWAQKEIGPEHLTIVHVFLLETMYMYKPSLPHLWSTRPEYLMLSVCAPRLVPPRPAPRRLGFQVLTVRPLSTSTTIRRESIFLPSAFLYAAEGGGGGGGECYQRRAIGFRKG